LEIGAARTCNRKADVTILPPFFGREKLVYFAVHELRTSIGSADLLAGSALIRYIPSHPDQADYTLAG
jgi:hypothetical protein